MEFVGNELGESGIGLVAEQISSRTEVGIGIKHAYNWIRENGEIGTITLAVYGIGLGVWASEVRGGGRGEVAASGEAPDADAVGPDTEFCGARPNIADGALGVPEFDRVTVLGAEAVFENGGADAEVIEPSGDLRAFVIHGEMGITAAGADDDTCQRFVGAGGWVEGE